MTVTIETGSATRQQRRSMDNASKRACQSADLLVSTAITGATAGAVSAIALALFAIAEGKGPLQPVNATSHWLNGPEAGCEEGADFIHTGVGYVTHHASALFWALPLEAWVASRPNSGTSDLIGKAAAITAVAAAFDYGIVHRRLTPGWEHAVSTKAIAGGFVALGLGLAGGALLSRAVRLRG